MPDNAAFCFIVFIFSLYHVRIKSTPSTVTGQERETPDTTILPVFHRCFSTLRPKNGHWCAVPGCLLYMLLLLCGIPDGITRRRGKQNSLTGPDSKEKHPQKQAEHNNCNACHSCIIQLKTEPFAGFLFSGFSRCWFLFCCHTQALTFFPALSDQPGSGHWRVRFARPGTNSVWLQCALDHLLSPCVYCNRSENGRPAPSDKK